MGTLTSTRLTKPLPARPRTACRSLASQWRRSTQTVVLSRLVTRLAALVPGGWLPCSTSCTLRTRSLASFPCALVQAWALLLSSKQSNINLAGTFFAFPLFYLSCFAITTHYNQLIKHCLFVKK